MANVSSYSSRLRGVWGASELLLPGALVLLKRGPYALFQQRADTGEWEIPGGSSEPGQSFSDTAVVEVKEELGLTVHSADLTAFASFSNPGTHRFTYPNGDRVHGFALCFVTEWWTGNVSLSPDEVKDWRFSRLAEPPQPLRHLTQHVLHLHQQFAATGRFQVD